MSKGFLVRLQLPNNRTVSVAHFDTREELSEFAQGGNWYFEVIDNTLEPAWKHGGKNLDDVVFIARARHDRETAHNRVTGEDGSR